jgi:hypothetical protein
MNTLRIVGFLFAFGGSVLGLKAQESVPAVPPAAVGQAVTLPGPELKKAMGGMRAGQKFLLVVLTPGGVDATLTESAKHFGAVAREDAMVVSADESQAATAALYREVVQGLRVVDFPYTAVFSKEGVPLSGMAAGAQSADDAAMMVAKWVADGGEIVRLQAAVAAADPAAKGVLMAQLIGAQGAGFAVSVQPDLPAKLREASMSGVKELDAIRAEVDDYVSKRQFQELYDTIMDPMAEAIGNGDLEKCLGIIGKLIEERKPAALTLQRLEMQRFRMSVNAKAFDRALEFLGKAEAAAPASAIASRIPKFRAQVEAAKVKAAEEPKPAAGEVPKPAEVPAAPGATAPGAP